MQSRIAGIVLLNFLCVLWPGFLHARVIAVTTITLKLKERIEPVTFLGILKSKDTALIQTKTAGPINHIYHFPGDQVKTGDLLLELDDTTQKIKLAVAKQMFDKANVGLDTEQQNYDRAKVLNANHAISSSTFQLQKANYQSILSAYNNAKSNLELAELNLSYTKVISPMSGTINQLKVLQHAIVNVGTPLFVMSSIQNLTAIIPVTAQSRHYFSPKLKVYLQDPFTHKRIMAKVDGIGTDIDQKNHSFNVYMDFVNPGGWYPGQTVEAAFQIHKGSAFLVPQQAITYATGVPRVFIIQALHAKPIDIVQLNMTNQNVWITSPHLKEGMVIVVSRSSDLFDDAPVDIKPSEIR